MNSPFGLLRVKAVTILALAVLLGPISSPAQDNPDRGGPIISPVDLDPPPYFLLLKRDATAIATAPLDWDAQTWRNVGIGVGVLGALLLADTKVREEVVRHTDDETELLQLADGVEPFGADYSWAVLAGFYGAGRYFDNPRASAVAQDGLAASLIAAGVITPALKSIVGRSRPSQSERNYEFIHKGDSFPSGHTTQAFAVASVIAAHYDSLWVDALAFGIAGTVGYARIMNGAHFTSDVVAGALIGIAVGRAVVRLHEEQRSGFRLEPLVTANGGVGVAVRFQLR